MKMTYWKISLFFLMIITITSATLYAENSQTPKQKGSAVISIPALCYHRIITKIYSPYDLTPAMLEKHFQLLKKEGFHPITAAEYLYDQKHPNLFPSKPIIISFDDGNKSHYRHVFPLLKKYGFKATFFIYPNAVSKKTTSQYLITWNELAEMIRGGMDIESHTLSHPFLTETRSSMNNSRYLTWLDQEFGDSKAILEQKLKIKINSVAYSYGWYNSVVEGRAVKAGYQGIFTTNWGANSQSSNALSINRKVISNELHLGDFDRYINSKPLPVDVSSPQDGQIFTKSPVDIQFKVLDPGLKKITMVIRRSKLVLTPDSQGIISYKMPLGIKPGFYMIILSAVDSKMNYYMSSWGFDYRNPDGSEIAQTGP
jgi:peptidoglycan/xylan/chitin deacetylase (PgdA/CDA1 family)